MEIWKPVTSYDGLYAVSSLGRVKSLERKASCRFKHTRTVPEKILKTATDRYGYFVVTLYKKGQTKTIKVHRLVAAAFLGDSALVVNHKDCDKQNNRVENLEYTTVLENARHARKNVVFNLQRGEKRHNFKLTDELKNEIRAQRGKASIQEIGRRYGIHPMTCYKVWNSN